MTSCYNKNNLIKKFMLEVKKQIVTDPEKRARCERTAFTLMIKEHNFYGFMGKVNRSSLGTLKKSLPVARGLGSCFCGVFFFWFYSFTNPTAVLSSWYFSVINLKGELTSSLLSYLTAWSFACGCYIALRDILYNNADVIFQLAWHIYNLKFYWDSW